MEIKQLTSRLSVFIKKYRYVAIVLLIGIILMCLPGKKQSNTQEAIDESSVTETEVGKSLDDSLGEILSQIKGAGNVHVLLTVQKGEETVFQTDLQTSQNNENGYSQIETVIISGQERNQSGLVKQVNPPMYMGAIVVCQGADSPTVRLAIVEAVSKVTGLGADRISVFKMK